MITVFKKTFKKNNDVVRAVRRRAVTDSQQQMAAMLDGVV
jgi:hypothetical protein